MSAHPNLLDTEHSLLVVIDVQSKLLAAMPEKSAELLLANTGILVEAAGRLKIPLLLTEQYSKGLGVTDTAIIQKLPVTFQVFDKTSFSCCAASGFMDALAFSRRKQIVLVGLEAHVCVLQTALELLQLGYHVQVVEDALCSRFAEHKHYALQRMQQQGVTITNHESVLFEWLKNSAHLEFKPISSLLRKS